MPEAAPGHQDRSAFQDRFCVPIDTMDKLDQFAALLTRWQKKINLVGPKTIDTLWSRHFWDSAQLASHLPVKTETVMDIGSGAGLPGLILAVIADVKVHSVESDGRKIAFQRQAAFAMGVSEKVVLHNNRIETLDPLFPQVITARAFAPLQKLFELSHAQASPETLWILPKGQNVGAELEKATKCWTFHVKQVHSETDDAARLLLFHSVERTP